MQFTIQVNGAPRHVDIDGETPLLWVLRDTLDLKGTKFGCGAAQCGACTVHMDGHPIRSCQTPIASVGNAAITTIEAIGESKIGRERAGGLDRPGRAAMRLLPGGPDHVGHRPAGARAGPDRPRHQRRDERQCLPLRHLHADPRGHQASRGSGEDLSMLARRNFLRASLAIGGGLLLTATIPAISPVRRHWARPGRTRWR